MVSRNPGYVTLANWTFEEIPYATRANWMVEYAAVLVNPKLKPLLL